MTSEHDPATTSETRDETTFVVSPEAFDELLARLDEPARLKPRLAALMTAADVHRFEAAFAFALDEHDDTLRRLGE